MNIKVLLQGGYNCVRILMLKAIHQSRLNIKYMQRIHPACDLIFKRGCRVTIGCNICTSKNSEIYVGEKGTISIGQKCFFNRGLIISCQSKLSIGQNCIFGPDVKLYDDDHCFDKENGIHTSRHKVGEIIIGDRCWIAANVVVLRGTVIGNNCVVGAGCIVKGTIPDNSVVTATRELIITPMR